MSQFKTARSFGILCGLMLCGLSSMASAEDGFNSIGDTLPIGAGDHTVLIITGSTQSAQFMGSVIIGQTQNACTAENMGSIRYYAPDSSQAGTFQGCDGSAWEPLGQQDASFNVVSTLTPESNTQYLNYTGGPLLLSSICPDSPNSSGYREAVDYYVFSPDGTQTQEAHGQIAEGGSDANLNAAPYASVMVPAGYSWATVASSTCQTTATGNTSYTVASCGSGNGAALTSEPSGSELCASGSASEITSTFSATPEQCSRGGGGRSGSPPTIVDATVYAGHFSWTCVGSYTTASCQTVTPLNPEDVAECKAVSSQPAPKPPVSHGK